MAKFDPMRIITALEAGEGAKYRSEQRKREAKDRDYADRLKEASGEIVTNHIKDPEKIIGLAAKYEVNPMDLQKVLADFGRYRTQSMQAGEYEANAPVRKAQSQVAMGEAETAQRRSRFTDDVAQSLQQGFGGEFNPIAAPAGAEDEAPRDPIQVMRNLTGRGVAAGVPRGEIGAMGEALGLPKMPGMEAPGKDRTYKMYRYDDKGNEEAVDAVGEKEARFYSKQGYTTVKKNAVKEKPAKAPVEMSSSVVKRLAMTDGKANPVKERQIAKVGTAYMQQMADSGTPVNSTQAGEWAMTHFALVSKLPRKYRSRESIVEASKIVVQMLTRGTKEKNIKMALAERGATSSQIEQIIAAAHGASPEAGIPSRSFMDKLTGQPAPLPTHAVPAP